MYTRPATSADSETIARYLFMAMEEIVYQFIESKDEKMTLGFLNHFTAKTINQYSSKNCFIGEIDGDIITVEKA